MVFRQVSIANFFQKIPKSKVNSITYDNGVQFEKHQDTEQKLQKQTNNLDFSIATI
jgi:IS30 family transposase